MPKTIQNLIWIAIGVFGAACLGGIAIHRGETINAFWFIAAAFGIYAVAYRLYAGWICTRVLMVDPSRATPALRINDGRDYVPTHRWITFGHHFAAIAGAGPLVGPTLAAQFGYLPGTLWLLTGAVIGGCVQDMVVLWASTRRDGRTLGQMARDELGPVAGGAALVGTLMIMVLIVAVLGLVVVNAMKHSPWGTFTVAMTIPIAILVGIYMRNIRPGRVLEGSLIGLFLLLAATAGGGWVAHHPALGPMFDFDGTTLALLVIGYGFFAAIMPVWLLLAPRDYISTFIKIGAILLLAFAVIILRPELHMPALTQFTDGTGPVVAGGLYPFLFITIACGAVSGFHALISAGTTPKLIMSERDLRLVGYGSMAMESFVGVMALIAACVLDPGVYFAINSSAGIVGSTLEQATATISSWGFPVEAQHMMDLAKEMGETTLLARTGGAPSLAVGMAQIFAGAFGQSLLALWYHFAIMFEALFILTAVDAGTRVGRFMLQDLLGNIWKPLGNTAARGPAIICSAVFVASWGYFLYIGVIDPYGGINILWPLFGISNQMLAAIALAIVTTILVKKGMVRYAWVTGLPMVFLAVTTSYAAWLKLFDADPRVGFLAGANTLEAKLQAGTLTGKALESAPHLIFNQRLDAGLTVFFIIVLWVVIIEMARISIRHLQGKPVPALSEAPYVNEATLHHPTGVGGH
jgi:carbon starvation protein